AGIALPKEAIRVPIGARTQVIATDEFAAWVEAALGGTGFRPLNRRRDALRTIAQQELLRRTESDETWSKAGGVRDALTAAWPLQQPKAVLQRLFANSDMLAAAANGILSASEQSRLLAGGRPGTKRRPWTAADQLLLDEVNSLLNGPPFLFGHVVV